MIRQPEEFKSLGAHRPQFSPSQVERMRRAREDGLSLAEVGRRFGCDPKYVSKLLAQPTGKDGGR